MADKRLHMSDKEVKSVNQELSKRHNLAGIITLIFIVIMLAFAI